MKYRKHPAVVKSYSLCGSSDVVCCCLYWSNLFFLYKHTAAISVCVLIFIGSELVATAARQIPNNFRSGYLQKYPFTACFFHSFIYMSLYSVIFQSTRLVCCRVCAVVQCPSVFRLSVCPFDRLLHSRCPAAKAPQQHGTQHHSGQQQS